MPTGVYKRTQENKNAISNSLKNRIFTDEWKQKISIGLIGKKHTEETKKKLSDLNKGKHSSISTEFKKGNKLSDDTIRKMKGRIPWNKGTASKKSRDKHQGSEYVNWRNSVFQRDNYICQFCGARGGYIEADHIKEWSKYPELRFVIDNGRTLWKPCHKFRHSRINNLKKII